MSIATRITQSAAQSVTQLGAAVVDAGRQARAIWLLLLGAIAGSIRTLRKNDPSRRPGEVWRQLHNMANRSFIFLTVTLGFIGMVMIYQSCLQISRVTGDYSPVGGQFIRLAVSDFGPTLTALMLATRVGAGIAAEIGSMKVTEQIDALRMCGVAPVDFLIAPRLSASIVATIALSVLSCAIMFGAGGMTAHFSFNVNFNIFFDITAVRPVHVILGMIKAFSYGVAIPIVSGYCGLTAQGSSQGVGRATTSAVIGSSFAVITLDFVISTIALLVVPEGL
jgi:phospholipid/cholesterol/gamma-HCH transport system permease protein